MNALLDGRSKRFLISVVVMTLVPSILSSAPPNPLNLPDPTTASAVDVATALNALTPQAIPDETNFLGTIDMREGGSKEMIWNASFPFAKASPTCPQGSTGLVSVWVWAPVVPINSYNEHYQILIARPDNNYAVQVTLVVPTLNGSEEHEAVLTVNPPGSGMFAGATVATVDFHPRTFLPQTLRIVYPGGYKCYTIVPNLQPQLGAFVIPYLPVTIVYQPPGCGQCTTTTPTGNVVSACGSTASYTHGTKIGTTVSWGKSTTSGTIKTEDTNEFFNDLSQAASGASAIVAGIPGGQAASEAFDKMGKVASFLAGLANTETITSQSQTTGQTESEGWTISDADGAQTDICQSDDLFVYLKDVVFIYAVVPKDPVSGNVTPNGVPTVILTPYSYKSRRQAVFSQLQNDLPPAVIDQFRALDLRMNPHDLAVAVNEANNGSLALPLIGIGRRPNPRLLARPSEECPALPGSGYHDVLFGEEHIRTSETSTASTTTTTTNVTGLLKSIFQIDSSGTITGPHPGETTQSITYSSASSNWTSVSTDAGLHLKCPEYAPAPGLEVDVYFDKLLGTFLTIPGQVETNDVVAGTVTNLQRHPAANREVLLQTATRTYRTTSDARGRFAFRFASIPKGAATLVVGPQTFPVNYNGTPVRMSLTLNER